MTAKALIFGHEAWYDQSKEAWRYCDNDEFVEECEKLCPECNQSRTEEGYDPCIGYIPGATSVCCGHGKKDGWIGW